MGGNRRGLPRTYLNLAVVWLLTGFWHGANWNFVLWGVYFLIILIVEKAFLLRALEKLPAFLRHVYALLLITVGFLIFSFPDAGEGWRCFCALWGVGCAGFSTPVAVYQLVRYLPLLLIAAIGATPLPRNLFGRFAQHRKWTAVLVPVLCLAALLLCTAYLVDSTYSPFAYTQF